MAFKAAVKEKLWGRIALDGPSGGGKSMTAFRIGMGMLPPGGRMAVIDTERGSARKYIGEFGIEFDVDELQSFAPQNYVKAINEAAKAKYPVLVIDSASHAWFGEGGLLEQVDDAAKRDTSGNSFTAWKKGTPIQNEFIDAMLSYPGHIIITMRTKMEHVMEKDSKGKTIVRKVGMKAIQRDGMEYEFDIYATVNIEHEMIIDKTRCRIFKDAIIPEAGPEFAAKYLEWLNTGAERSAAPAPPSPSAPAATVAPAPPPIDPQLRGEVETQLSACHTVAALQAVDAKLKAFTKDPDIRKRGTGVAGETFGTLMNTHYKRVLAEVAVGTYPARVAACASVADLNTLIAEHDQNPLIADNQPCIDALAEKAKEMGVAWGEQGGDEGLPE